MVKRSYSLFFAMLLLTLPASAQNAQPGLERTEKLQPRQVMGSASENRIRFSCLGEMIQLRIEVIGPAGDVLYDSGFKSGNVLDWNGLDTQGQRLAEGLYLCVVTVKDAKDELTRRQAIAVFGVQTVSLRRAEKSVAGSAQAQAAAEMSDQEESVVILEPDTSAATAILAHDGSTAQLVSGSGGLTISSGDFFSNKALEHMRLTAEGNLGIGVLKPRAKLDVAGLIRTSHGIIFPDGSIQTTAAKDGVPGQMPDQRLPGAPGVSGIANNGTGKGKGRKSVSPEFNVNEDLTINGNIIFTPPSSGFTRDITMQNNNGGLRFFGAPTLTSSPAAAAIQFWGNNSPFPGQLFLDSGANSSAALIFRTTGTGETITERMRVTATGNVGIGTATPDRALTVQRSAGAYINAISSSGPFEMLVGADSSGGILSTMTNHDLQLRAGGNSTKMVVKADGNVGIGTASPAAKLTVSGSGLFNAPGAARFDLFNNSANSGFLQHVLNTGAWQLATTSGATRMLVDSAGKLTVNSEVASSGSTGGIFSANNPNNQSARVLLDWFNDGAKDWPRIRYGGGGEGGANGFLIQGPGDATKLAVLQNGNVGIGTTNPQAKLVVSGDGNASAVGAARFDLFNTTAERRFSQHVDDSGIWRLDTTSSITLIEVDPAVDATVNTVSVHTNLAAMESFRIRDLETLNPAPNLLCHTGGQASQLKQVGNCSSSIRYKKNIHPFTPGLALIRRLRPVSFNWKGSDLLDFGLVAEEVAEVEPLLVTHNDAGEIQGVKYERLGVVVINALKEQQAQIEALRQTVSSLQRQNEEMAKRWRALTRTTRSLRHNGR